MNPTGEALVYCGVMNGTELFDELGSNPCACMFGIGAEAAAEVVVDDVCPPIISLAFSPLLLLLPLQCVLLKLFSK
jgi:hypothetical protein